ncbi:MAG: BON domain-containing protein [Elusimicrobiota bacterium]|nr:MAG: BON domain-containing protein [Elusimicrobiota bacterium]
MKAPILAAAIALAAPVAALAAASPQQDKTGAAEAGEAEPRDPSMPVEGAPSPRPGFEPPATTIPQTVKPPVAEGTSRPVTKSDEQLGRDLEAALLDERDAPRVEGLSIVVEDGKVRIRGRVTTQAEKDAVTAKAGAAAGLRNVTNEIEVGWR